MSIQESGTGNTAISNSGRMLRCSIVTETKLGRSLVGRYELSPELVEQVCHQCCDFAALRPSQSYVAKNRLTL